MQTETALAPVARTPLAEIPAKALILVSKFTEKRLVQTENVVIDSGVEDGTVDLFAMSSTRAIFLTCLGTCQRRLEIGGESLAMIRKRHSDADHVAIASAAAISEVSMLSIRSFSENMTLALQVPEGHGGLSAEQVETTMGALRSESEPRATTVLDRQLLSQTLALLAPQGQIRLEQRHRGVVLHITADDFTGMILVCGIVQPE